MIFSMHQCNRLWRPAFSSKKYTMSACLGNHPTPILAATAESGANGPDETSGTRTTTPQQAPAARDWQSLLIIVLAIAIGVTFARTAPARLLGLNDYWAAFAVEIAAAGLAGGIVASLVRWIFKLFGSPK